MQFDHAKNMRSVVIYQREGWNLKLQIIDNHPFLHINGIEGASLSVVKQIKECVPEMEYLLASLGYPYIFGYFEADKEALLKFYLRLGFKHLKTFTDSGNTLELVVIECKDKQDA